MEKQIDIQKKPAKRKYIIAAVALLLIIASLVYIYITQEEPKPDRNSEIVIRNAAAWQFYVETKVKKDPNDLTDEDFAKITELIMIPSMGSGGVYYWIDPATGRKFTALTSGELSDIQLLRKFTNLKSLYLENIRFPQKEIPQWMKLLAKVGIYDLNERFSLDLSPLKDLPNLESLSLPASQVIDIKPLSNFKNLKELNLSNTGIKSLEPIRGLVNLQVLDISIDIQAKNFPRVPITTLEPIKGLVNLQELNLIGTKVSNLEPIKGLVNLKRLDIRSYHISNLEPLKDLTQLEFLLCNGVKVTDLKPLQGLINLDILSLYYTPVTNLEPLKGLKKLRLLDIGHTDVSNLEPLKELKNLNSLFIENCEKIPNEQIEALHKALPFLSIINNWSLDF
jgi:Leucine-rich repeat (LRR) protein